MASEATVLTSLSIVKGSLRYQSQPTTFLADVSGTKGPTPGAITATTAGTDIDLSQLVQPGLYKITNLEPSGGNYVEYGIRDVETGKFHVWGEMLPGETYVGRFSRNLGEEYFPSTGTGTSAPTDKAHLKANKASVIVQVEAFES